MKLKHFAIHIKGTFCEVPHPKRMMAFSISDDTDETFSDADLFVVVHEVLCKMKRDLQAKIGMDKIAEWADKHMEQYKKFHVGKDENAKTKAIYIEMYGKFCENQHPERFIAHGAWEYIGNNPVSLNQEETLIILLSSLTILRDQLAETMNRDEMAEFAKKHEIYNFGMRKEEEPFVKQKNTTHAN